jgi:hypothetical protein
MRKRTWWTSCASLLIALVGASPPSAPAAEMDGTVPILCAVIGTHLVSPA